MSQKFWILSDEQKTKLKCYWDAFWKTTVTVMLTMLPILSILIKNHFNHIAIITTGISFALLISYAYSFLTPSILSLFCKNYHNKIFIIATIFSGLILTMLITAMDLNAKFDKVNITITSVSLFITIILLFFSMLKEETDSLIKWVSRDKKDQNVIKQYSTNVSGGGI